VSQKSEPLFRFAVTKKGRICSGTWCAKREKDNIYLYARTIGGEAKFSLHCNERGRKYRFAETPERVRRTTGGDGSRRAIVAWDGQDTPSIGVSHALSILFAPELLRSRNDLIDSDVRVLELPADGSAIQLDVTFTFSDQATIAFTEQQAVLGHTRLSSGENCIVVASVSGFDFEKFRNSSNLTTPTEKALILTPLDDPNMSCVLIGEPCGHGLRVIEISNILFTS
jgi:hypothetical protein